MLGEQKAKRNREKVGACSSFDYVCGAHSWASVARGKHIPLSVISEGMGHDSEKNDFDLSGSIGYHRDRQSEYGGAEGILVIIG